MDRTNYVDKAKNLMLRTARTTALVIVPLAAAVSAQATPVITALPTSNFVCTAGLNPCSGGGVSPISNSGGITGASFYTSGSQSIGYTSGGAYNLTLTMSAYGASSGSLPASIPVDWDFTIGAPNGITVNSWSLVLEMSDAAVGNGDLGSVTEPGSGTGTFQGADTLNLVGGSPSNIYETALLTVDTSGNGSGNIFVNVISGSSFDFNGAQVPSSTPEPASVGLMAAGLAFFGALLRRRRKQ